MAKTLERYAQITGIHPDKIAYYKELHAAVWPEILKQIKACNIQNYSIYLKEIDSKHFLFSYFEYTGIDFETDMKKMAEDETTQRWWKETNPTQMPLPDAAANNKIWSRMGRSFLSILIIQATIYCFTFLMKLIMLFHYQLHQKIIPALATNIFCK